MRFLSKWNGRGKPAARQIARTRLNLEELESRLVPYAVTGNAWPQPELVTISFVPDGTILGSNQNGYIYSNLFATFNNHPGWTTATWEKQILRAAAAWAQQTNINLAVVPDNGAAMGTGNYQQGDPNKGDIRIGGYNFGTSTLAQAFQPPPVNNYSIAGDIQFNTGQPFNIGSTYDLFTVAAHEFGHALGMDESSTATAVMYGTYNGVKNGLTTDDNNGIRSIYSSGTARTGDVYNGTIGSFATAADISSQVDPLLLTGLVNNLDLNSIDNNTGARTTTQTEYFKVTAPLLTLGTFTTEIQSAGLSLLSPTLTVYASDQTTVLGSACGAGQYGTTLTVTVTGVSAGQQFYIKVAGSETTTLGSGEYALALDFGILPLPCVPIPNTETLNGYPLHAGGGEPEEAPNQGVGDTLAPDANLAMAATPTPAATAPIMSATPDALAALATGFRFQLAGPVPMIFVGSTTPAVPAVPVLPVLSDVPVQARGSSEGSKGTGLELALVEEQPEAVILPMQPDLASPAENAVDTGASGTDAQDLALWIAACDRCLVEEAVSVARASDPRIALFTETGEPVSSPVVALAALAMGWGGWRASTREEVRPLPTTARRAQPVC